MTGIFKLGVILNLMAVASWVLTVPLQKVFQIGEIDLIVLAAAAITISAAAINTSTLIMQYYFGNERIDGRNPTYLFFCAIATAVFSFIIVRFSWLVYGTSILVTMSSIVAYHYYMLDDSKKKSPT